jgi:hypothetical protein
MMFEPLEKESAKSFELDMKMLSHSVTMLDTRFNY